MKLYEIPKGSKILLPIVEEGKDLGMQMCTFDHLDGVYGHISTPDGYTVHLAASTKLKEVGEHYELGINL